MTKDKSRIAGFVDPNKDPQYYISRYYREKKYQEWFDRNYPNLTIDEAVGLVPLKKSKKSASRGEVLFVVGALSLVVFAFFFISGPNTFLGSLMFDISEPNWNEVSKSDTVKNSIPIVLLEQTGGDCKVSASRFDIIIDHPYFVRGQDLAAQLNYDKKSETLILPCNLLHGEKSRLNVWYAIKEAPLHAEKFQYFVEPWVEENDLETTELTVP